MSLYDNEAIQEYVSEVLFTKIVNSGRVNVDNTLTARPGESIKIFRYSGKGAAEKVVEGSGNTNWSDIEGTDYSYEVATTQDRCKITDEELARNPLACDYKLKVIAAHLYNAMNQDIERQWMAGTQVFSPSAASGVPTLPEFMSAFGLLDVGLDGGYNGKEETVACHFSSAMWLEFQKGLLSNTLVEYDVVNGELVPKINGRQIIVSDHLLEYCKDMVKNKLSAAEQETLADEIAALYAAAKKVVIFETDQAVRLCKGKKVASESERHANERRTDYYVRDNYVAALEFNDKVATIGVEAFEDAWEAVFDTLPY